MLAANERRRLARALQQSNQHPEDFCSLLTPSKAVKKRTKLNGLLSPRRSAMPRETPACRSRFGDKTKPFCHRKSSCLPMKTKPAPTAFGSVARNALYDKRGTDADRVETANKTTWQPRQRMP